MKGISGLLSKEDEMNTHSAVSLLGGRCLPGEQDQLGAVHLQALDIDLQRLSGLVAAAVVH